MRRWRKHTFSLLNTSIRIKLLIAPAVLILALLLISILAVNGLNFQANALNQANEIVQNQITLIDQFTLLSEQIQSNVYRIAVLRFMELPEEEIQPVQASLEQGVNELKIMYGEISTTWLLDETERSMLANLKGPMDEFILQATQSVKVVNQNPSFGVLMVRSSALSYNKFKGILANFLDYQNEKIARTKSEMMNRTNALKVIIAIFLLLTALAGIVISLFISTRLIAQPIQEVTRIMSRLAENDLSFELHNLDRGDEIGAMLHAVEVFRDNAIEKNRLDEELRESERRLLLAQEVAHVGNWELDLASNTLWASAEAFRIYGLERSSPYLPLEVVQKVPVSEDRPHLDTALTALLEKQVPYNEEFRVQRPKDKTARVIHSLANLICDEKGAPVKIVGVIQDVTKHKQAEQEIKAYSEKLEEMVAARTHELREAQEKLVRQERLAVLGQMAGSVGHELRNPLGVISNAIYFLKMAQPEASEKVKEYLGIIDAEAHTADKIINDLLDFSRIKSIELESVVVSDLVMGTLERFPAPATVQVTVNLPANLPTVYVDPRQMTQVLGNLVLNACQAMHDGGKLAIATHQDENMIAIAVNDTGGGILPENINKIFEPLFTTKPTGIGLGLAVSQKLAQANGGRIEVESEPGKGSTFTIYLPVDER